jgi:hypothetical protein
MSAPKRKLVTVEKVVGGREDGMWICRDWRRCFILVRGSRREALEDGLAYAIGHAGRACLDLSLFDVSLDR